MVSILSFSPENSQHRSITETGDFYLLKDIGDRTVHSHIVKMPAHAGYKR